MQKHALSIRPKEGLEGQSTRAHPIFAGMSHTAALLEDFVGLINCIGPIQLDPASITLDTELESDLSLDSISLVALLALCEEFFEIRLGDEIEKIVSIQTVGDALDLIASLRASSRRELTISLKCA